MAVETGRVGIAGELPATAGVRLPAKGEGEEEEVASSSSSIGENSDGPGAGGSGPEEEEEVQSAYKGPIESLDVLEETLPMRRGISKFYCGKSKSFTSLADAASSSVKNLAKPENAYTRKRKNLLAYKNMWGRPRDNLHPNPAGGLLKKLANNSNSDDEDDGYVLDPAELLPPLGPPRKPAAGSAFDSTGLKKCSLSMRSFSMADLQGTSNSRNSNG